jgi:hypothetical protein
MCRQITISRIKAGKAIAQHQEMARLVVGHPQPVIKEGTWQRSIGVTASHIKRQIDGIQLDMRNGMHQGNAPAGRWANAAAWHITRGFQFSVCRAVIICWPGISYWSGMPTSSGLSNFWIGNC